MTREESFKKLEKALARVDFWHAIQMSLLVGLGIFLFGLL